MRLTDKKIDRIYKRHLQKKKELKYNLFEVTAFILFVIGIIIIGFTFFIFFINGYVVWKGDIHNTLFADFGDFIGGVVGTCFSAVAIFLVWGTYKLQKKELAETRNLLQQQIESSYRPDLFLKSINFCCINSSGLDSYKLSQFIFYQLEENEYQEVYGGEETILKNLKNRQKPLPINPLIISLYNLGVEAAKGITYLWYFSEKEVDEFYRKNNIPVFVPSEKQIINGSIPFLLPIHLGNNHHEIIVPNLYLCLFFYAVYYINSEDVMSDFPKLILQVIYDDIAGNRKLIKFEFNFHEKLSYENIKLFHLSTYAI